MSRLLAYSVQTRIYRPLLYSLYFLNSDSASHPDALSG
ncbi:Uncharacterised protein [Afipia felis]|nr:Uncharacterised protein [Afipia felis]